MEKDLKELLLKDLCARLPYGVIIHIDEKTGQDDERLYGMRENGGKLLINDAFYIEKIKPYLLPFSSMGPAEYVEFVDLGDETSNDCFGSFNFKQLDWLNAHHFDYRRLIKKGLAIDATELNIY